MNCMVNHPEILFEAHNLEFKSNQRKILHSVNLEIRKGEVCVITGASGGGKTILAKIFSGDLKPSGGQLYFHKKIKTELVLQQDQFILASGLRTTFYGQRYESFNQETIPTVADYFRRSKLNFQEIRLKEINNDLQIENLLPKKLLSLSNGERKRVQLALALLKFPDLLILDQPFVGLDVYSREKLEQLIQRKKIEGCTFIIISDFEHIPVISDTVFELSGGTISQKALRREYHPFKIKETIKFNALNEYFMNELAIQKTKYEFVVRMKNVNVTLGGKKVLHNIDWDVKQGEQWILTGHNGAGKTTLLSLITADNPQGYTNDLVLFDRKRGSGESIWDIKRKIGFVSPELHLYFLRKRSIYHPARGTQINYDSLSNLEVVLSGFNDEVGLNTSNSGHKISLAKKWLKILNLDHIEKSHFLFSSLGEQRIVLLLRALVKLPDLLILDEPCQGLDPSQTRRFLSLLDLICKNRHTTMVYVTHRPEEIPSGATHQMELENGFVHKYGVFAES